MGELEAVIAFGIALMVHLNKARIRAWLDGLDQAFLNLFAPKAKQIAEIEPYTGRHRLKLTEPCYRHDRWTHWYETSLEAQPR